MASIIRGAGMIGRDSFHSRAKSENGINKTTLAKSVLMFLPFIQIIPSAFKAFQTQLRPQLQALL